MRISDWSSDVCSSDLSVLQCVPTLLTRLVACEPFREIAGTSLRLIIYGGESIPFATLAAATDAFGPILAQNYGLTEAMMTCTHLPPREHLIDGNGESRALRHGVIGRPYPFVELVLRDANGAPRSEEHTSELQSLMSISYAVFCLKKKNQNTIEDKRYTL